MFDASFCAAADLRQMTDLIRQLVEFRLEELRRLGHSRDIELLFWHCHNVERRTREFCVPNVFKRPRLSRATCS